jgi:hypothetical protein
LDPKQTRHEPFAWSPSTSNVVIVRIVCIVVSIRYADILF